jgi:hypothetical protein
MPYRVAVPEGVDVATHLLHNVGTSGLLASRVQLVNATYDAPLTTLTAREREAPRILYALRSGCPVCSGLRLWRDKPGFTEAEIEDDFYQAAMNLELGWPGFTDRERTILEFADRFDRDVDGINDDDDLWERVYAQLTESEVGDLLILIGSWLATGRAIKVLGVASAPCALRLGERTDVSYADIRSGAAATAGG